MQTALDQRTGVQTPKFRPVEPGVPRVLRPLPETTTSWRTGGCYPATPSHVAVMLLSKPDTPSSEPLPAFTHEVWRASRPMGGKIVPQHVQVKQGCITLCGQIVDAWSLPEGGDFWKLRLLDGIVRSVGVNRTVQCSGLDGRCSCAGERATNLVAAQ